MFMINKVYEPFDQGDDQDMWVIEIDQVHVEDRLRSDDNIDHVGCIEIRAVSSEVAFDRAHAIVDALNGWMNSSSRFALNGDNVKCVETDVSTAFERARVVV